MDIPGYKWDRERKRYFKVLKTGELPNSSYTVSALASKDRNLRRSLSRQDNNDYAEGDNVLEDRATRRLGSRSRVIYSVRSRSTISSFSITPKGVLAGGRDGTLALGEWKSEVGRSITQICEVGGVPAVAAVDNDAGSFVGYGAQTTQLKGQFVTQMCGVGNDAEPCIAMGSQLGLHVWNPGVTATEVIKAGSVSAAARGRASDLIVGCRDGFVKLIDLRSRKPTAAGSLGNGKMVTHVTELATQPAILVSGLEDRMMLFDIRSAMKPIYQYTGYENWSTAAHGFALSPDHDSVAVAMDTGAVQIFDVSSGRQTKTLAQKNKRSGVHSTRMHAPTVTCLQWRNEGLYMAVGNSIRAFPSTLQSTSLSLDADSVRYLEETHSNINLHKK